MHDSLPLFTYYLFNTHSKQYDYDKESFRSVHCYLNRISVQSEMVFSRSPMFGMSNRARKIIGVSVTTRAVAICSLTLDTPYLQGILGHDRLHLHMLPLGEY